MLKDIYYVADNFHKFVVVYYVADCFLTFRKFSLSGVFRNMAYDVDSNISPNFSGKINTF